MSTRSIPRTAAPYPRGRAFSVALGALLSLALVGTGLTPAHADAAPAAVPRALLTATASTQQVSSGEVAANVIDGNTSTIWHNQWSPETTLPQWIEIGWGAPLTIDQLSYTPRIASQPASGVILNYEIQTSTDGVTYTTATTGTWPYVQKTVKTASFTPVVATSVRLRALTSQPASGKQWAAASEVAVRTTETDKANALVTLKASIAAALAVKNDSPVGTTPGTWPQSAVDELSDAIESAQLGFLSASTVASVTAANSALGSAVDTFTAAENQVGKDALVERIAFARDLLETTEGTTPREDELAASIDAAQLVVDDPDATTSQIAAALDDLNGAIAAVQAGDATPFERQALNFNTDWLYKQGDVSGAQAESFNDSLWTWVNLPHSTKFNTPEDVTEYLGVSWYRKSFDTDTSVAGKKVFVEFEAAMQKAEVWVNGTKLTTHVGGYTPFTVDVTDVLKENGENTIAVRIDSTPSADWGPGKTGVDFRYFGGLYRDVHMTVVDPIHITDAVYNNEVAGGGVFITTPEVAESASTVKVRTDVLNESAVERTVAVHTEIVDADGTVVAEGTADGQALPAGASLVFEKQLTVTNAALWHPNHPDLYTARISVLADGENVDQYTERFGIRRIEWKHAGLFINGEKFEAIGTNKHPEIYGLGNAVPNDEQYLDVKRVKDAGFDFIRTSHFPNDPAFYAAADELGVLVLTSMTGWQTFYNTTTFKENTYKELRDMIRRDRNHPSIIAWETSLNESNYTAEWGNKVHSIAHEEFPGDQMYTAGWKDYFDIFVGASQHDIRETTNPKPIIISEWGDWDNGGNASTSRVPRESYDLPGFTNNNLKQASNHQVGLNANLAEEWFSADGLWDFADMSGYNATASLMGVIDYYRIPKFSYYFFQSQRDPEIEIPGVESGPMVFIANTWSATSPTTVTVYSNADQVRLIKNGTVVATQSPDTGANTASLRHAPFTFDAGTFAAGDLTAEALIDGEVVATHVRQTATAAKAIELVPETDAPISADGSDARLVHINVEDANGTIAYTNSAKVTVSVSGAGQLVGPSVLTMKGGQLAVWVRSKRSAGEITLTATSPGLTSATTTVETEEVAGLPEPQYDDTQISRTNIAAGAAATASSTASGTAATNVTDDSATSSWTAASADAGSSLRLDLGASYDLTGASLTWPAAAAYQYRLESSEDGIVWDTVADKTDSTTNSTTSTSDWVQRGRYLRVTFTGGLAGQAPSVSTFAAFGELASAPTPVDVAQEKTAVLAGNFAPGHTPATGNNGNPAEYWQAGRGGKVWWSVDLGDRYQLSSSIVTWLDGSKAFKYTIDVSNDGISYRTIVDRSTNTTAENESQDNFTATARFVRISVVGGSTTESPVGFYNFKALGVPAKDVIARKSSAASSATDGHGAALANDLIPSTSWVAEPGESASWTADLGADFTLDGVDVMLGDGSVTGFTLAGSADGTAWTTLSDRTASTSREALVSVSGTFRHLRVSFDGLDGGEFASITDISAYAG